ncbi:MAG: protease inhibitor I42 family protein [Actinomycetota bacterium]
MRTWMKWTAAGLAAVAALAIVACGDESNSPKSVELSVEDDGRDFALNPGDELTVTLESNASTGFRWVLVTEPDSGVLELLGSEYIAATTDLVGAPGVEVWRFRATGAGQTTLKLRYERASGETAGEPFQISVDVGSED